jgi:excisionase family DNA binding protein
MAATATAERVMRVREVADHLGVEKDTIYRLIREGKLRAIRLGRVLRVPQTALADFIAGVEPDNT